MELMISSVLAAGDPQSIELAVFGAVIAAGIIILGAAIGVGIIGGKAVESIARQPEAGGRIFMSMILAAALIEGATFFALLICFLAVFWLR